MLEFLERLMERAPDVPLYLLCTARPELYARRPGWAATVANATTISLSPLTDPEMSELLATLLLRTVTAGTEAGTLLRRAGGNPLYAREFVQMLEDRGDAGMLEVGDTRDPDVGVPDTVQALIAARLDALDGPDRVLLQAASVIGDRFWQGALAALEPGVADLETALRTLQRRGMIRRSSTSAIVGESEFSFAHALIRDVAYGRVPRAARSRLHHAVTMWLDATADPSMSTHADMVASHAVRALDLARAADLHDDLPGLASAAVRFLVIAGDRQQSLDAARAATSYRQALALAPAGDDHAAERAEIRRTATSLGWRSGGMTSDEAIEQYRTAEREAMLACDARLAARVLRRLYFQLGLAGDTTMARHALDRAITLVEGDPDALDVLSELYACRSEMEMFAGHSDESLRWAERALELPGNETVTLMALHLRGNARCEAGDLGGVDDLRRALELAEGSGVAIDIVTSHSYLLEWVGLEDGPSTALPMNRATVDLCQRRGIEGQGMWTRAEGFWLRFDAGLWDELLEEVGTAEQWSEDHGDTQIATVSRIYGARVLAHRGALGDAAELVGEFLPAARQIEDLQVLAPALVVAVVVASGTGSHEGVRSLAAELDSATAGGPTEYRELYLPEVVRALVDASDPELAAHIVGDRRVHVRRTRAAMASCRALLLEAGGDDPAAAEGFRDAEDAWRSWGGTLERAHALAGLGRTLDAGADAERASVEARQIFASLGVARTDVGTA
ncbi:hypothetical protein BH18ACT17_BH18ACT17_01240 [soil metagenome]